MVLLEMYALKTAEGTANFISNELKKALSMELLQNIKSSKYFKFKKI